jgi:hypothetical protein
MNGVCWCDCDADFETFWLREVAEFYDARGVSRPKARRTAVYRIAKDIGDRIGIAAGYIRPNDAPAPRRKKTG